MAANNKHLFKERITRSNSNAMTDLLTAAIRAGEMELKCLLIGTPDPDLYSQHGKYRDGMHEQCSGAKTKRPTEKRLCRCMYYRSKGDSPTCSSCELVNLPSKIVGEYMVKDYEVPAFYYGDGIGEIDLLLSDGTVTYATEVKPPKGNSETLLRMIAEIMTYTLGNQEGYKKAIAFFEGSRQDEEYAEISVELKTLIKEADITVFRFENIDSGAYKICRL